MKKDITLKEDSVVRNCDDKTHIMGTQKYSILDKKRFSSDLTAMDRQSKNVEYSKLNTNINKLLNSQSKHNKEEKPTHKKNNQTQILSKMNFDQRKTSIKSAKATTKQNSVSIVPNEGSVYAE